MVVVVAAASSLLAFDAHNHIQLGPSSSISSGLSDYVWHELKGCLCGMAPMSTHPRDFQPLLDLEKDIMIMNAANKGRNGNDEYSDNSNGDDNGNRIAGNGNSVMKIVPCLGVHPWFLHELQPDDWNMVPPSSPSSSMSSEQEMLMIPKWVANLEVYLINNPHVVVGEIGLDNFHFDPSTKELTTSMDRQIDAFRYQLQLATKHRRSVSVHCVRAMGKIMDTINDVTSVNANAYANNHQDQDHNVDSSSRYTNLLLPPRIYFHAFGGKPSTATQLIRTIEKIKPKKQKQKKKYRRNDSDNSCRDYYHDDCADNGDDGDSYSSSSTKVYFGFAPLINFNNKNLSSPPSTKTMKVIREVGIHRLVLETDHEDVLNIKPSMKIGIDMISNVLNVTPEELIRITNNNVNDLYNISL